MISVIIPVRNESDRPLSTIRSISETRSTSSAIEIIIVDDASEEDCSRTFDYESSHVTISVHRLEQRVGVPRARNHGAFAAKGDILFITDAHVRFIHGWDRLVLEHIRPDRILAATIVDPTSAFRGYGCSLTVPLMGTKWNRDSPQDFAPVHVPSCAGTVLESRLFREMSGYDPGMILYGGAEPEFGVRAWLSGAEIVSAPGLEVHHRFKNKAERDLHIEELRVYMTHNCLRFGLLYLSERASLQMLRYYSSNFPGHAKSVFSLLNGSDVWERRAFLKEHLPNDFNWFIDRFDLKDEVGEEILRD